MARSRTLKPGFFTDADLYDAEMASGLPLRLAYEGLWCQADREGRFVWKPRELKLAVLPFDPVNFGDVLDALASHGFIRRYAVDGREYGFIPNFKRHQHFHKNEVPSTLPEPSIGRSETSNGRHGTGAAPEEHRLSTPDTDTDTDTDAVAGAVVNRTEPAAAADLRDWLPPDYHPDLDAAIRSCHRPEALLAELRAIRSTPELRNLTPVSGEHVGMALRDAALKGRALTGTTLAGFIRVAQRAPPPVVGSIEQAVAQHDREREARRRRYAAGE